MKKSKKLLALMLCFAMVASFSVGLAIAAPADEEDGIILRTFAENLATGETVLLDEYTREDLGAIAEFPDPYYAYLFFQAENTRAVVVTELVTLGSLFGGFWAPGAELFIKTDDDFVSPFELTYENISDHDGYYSDPEDPDSYIQVPAGIALQWDGNPGGTSVDPDREENIAELAEDAHYSGSLRFVCGLFDHETGAGNRLISGIIEITVMYSDDSEDGEDGEDEDVGGETSGILAMPIEALAGELYLLGLFQGSGEDADGNRLFGLENELNRIDALVLTIRLLGLEDEALAYEGDNPFDDVTNWITPYATFAYARGITSGTTPTAFSPRNGVTLQMFSVFLLRSLGYSDTDGEDFAYNDALSFVLTAGLYDDDTLASLSGDGPFTRGDAVVAMANALLTQSADDGGLLIDALVEAGAVPQAAVAAFMEAVTK